MCMYFNFLLSSSTTGLTKFIMTETQRIKNLKAVNILLNPNPENKQWPDAIRKYCVCIQSQIYSIFFL